MNEIDLNDMEVESVDIPQTQVEEQQAESVAETQRPEAKQDHNWKEANRVLKSQKQELDALRQQLEEMKVASKPVEVDEFASLDPDDAITVAQARKLAEKQSKAAEERARQAAREVAEEYARNMTLNNLEDKTRQSLQDYDYVVENFAIPMLQGNPSLAAAVQASPNPFMTAYKLAKTSDEYEAQMTKQNTSPKADKILKNAARPNPGNSVSPSLKGQADAYAKMSQSDIWNMSQQYARKA